MRLNRAISHRLTMLSPWLTVGLLAGMSALLPNRSAITPGAQHQKALVAAAVKAVPHSIGRWVGQDVEVPREAQTLLRPNAILSRAYSSPGESTMRLLIVHCSDARDMIGHYPPICYPSAGWTQVDVASQRIVDLSCEHRRLPSRQYAFEFISEEGRPQAIRILNAFILPDGAVSSRIEDINRQSERLAVSARGVAQLQIITSASVPLDQTIAAANELLA
ncbi:MAG: exosortase-associated EpsI family protein, partial [Phycisphaerales bacterium]|nr:exosortase-associated EpsI family protein [Phycisphaerales bacterium]